MSIQSHRNLKVWQKAMEMVLRIYRITQGFPRSELYGLMSQLRRAAVSVPANIAEGNARGGRRDYAHFLSIARGSLTEAETLLLLARSLDYVTQSAAKPVFGLMDEISRMLKVLRERLLDNSPSGASTSG